MLSFLLKKRSNGSIDKESISSELLKIDSDGRDLYICGYELIRKRSNKDKELDPEILRSFIDTVRNKLPRTASLYITTLVRRYYGGTYMLCADKNEKIYSICELLATSLETLSKGVIKTKKLNTREVESIISLRNIQSGEYTEIHNLFADTIEIENINYSLKDLGTDNEDGIYLGETSRSRIKTRYMIHKKDLMRHIAIFGSTGSGKTTTGAAIAYRSYLKGFRIYILDWHGEYKSILGSYVIKEIKLRNLNELESLPIFKEPNQILEIFESVFDLSPAQSYILGRALSRLKNQAFSFRKLYDEISMFPEEARWVLETKLSLMRRVEQLIDEEYEESENRSLLNDLLERSGEKIISIDLSKLDRVSIRSLASLIILKTIAMISQEKSVMRREKDQANTLVILDEAHHVFKRSEGSSVAKDALAEIRKYNVGLVMITQSPSSVGDDILKNTNTKIIHSIRSEVDRRTLRDALSLPKDIEETMPLLEVGEAIVASASRPYPVIVKVDPSMK